jgi:hypothetical protein
MTTTTNYGYTLVEPNQSNKATTVNAAIVAIDADLAAVAAGSGVTMAGDVTGLAASTVVAKIQNRTVAATAPSDLQYLGWNNGSSQWEPKTISATTSVTMGGDVSGASGTATVDKIKGVAVSATTPTTGQALEYNGSAWAPATHPYDIGLTVTEAPTASEVLLRFVAPRAIGFVANFSTSYAKSGTAATGSTVFTIAKNGSSIGTVTFAASGTTGTWASSGGTAQSLAAGDVLTLAGPATPDATLAGIGFMFAGTR